ESDHGRELAVLPREAARSVDWVHNPQARSSRGGFSQGLGGLLGAEGIPWELTAEIPQDTVLGLSVRVGADTRRRVGDDLKTCVVVQNDPARRLSGFQGRRALPFVHRL